MGGDAACPCPFATPSPPEASTRGIDLNAPPDTDARGYDSVAKGFHWLVVALLAVQFGVAWTMPEIHRGTVPEVLITWHLSVGATILAVVLARLGWRATHRPPPAPKSLPAPLRLLSRATHYGLYALLIVLPVLGWANASSRGWPVKLFGLIALPPLVPTGSALGHQLGDVHKALATGLLALIALHTLGALYHGVVLRDRTLQRMLPFTRAPATSGLRRPS